MKNKLLMVGSLVGLMALIVSGCIPVAADPMETPAVEPPEATVELANPAAVFCEEQGYDYQIRQAADGGEYGVCVSPEGRECDGWAFYRGECSLDPGDEAGEGTLPTEWLTYANAEYGFAFSYPPEWTLVEATGGHVVAGGTAPRSIELTRGTLHLLVQYKHASEDTVLGPGGRGAGEIVDWGTVSFFEAETTKMALVYEDRVKSIFFGQPVQDLFFYIQLDDLAGSDVDYASIDLDEEIEAEFDRVVASFTLTQATTSWDVAGWLGVVVSNPSGAEFDDGLVLLPEGAGQVGIAGSTPELEAEIVSLRDKPEPGNQAHFWGTLTCDVPDVGGCQLLVTRVRYGASETAPEPVEGWVGTVVSNPAGAQFDDYLVLDGRFGVAYGIHSLDVDVQAQLEALRDTKTAIRIWGVLRCGVPDAFGSQIEVSRIEPVEG